MRQTDERQQCEVHRGRFFGSGRIPWDISRFYLGYLGEMVGLLAFDRWHGVCYARTCVRICMGLLAFDRWGSGTPMKLSAFDRETTPRPEPQTHTPAPNPNPSP